MKKYTIAEISRQTYIPESTLRYRTKLFKKFIKTIGSGRRRRFDESSIDRFRFIDRLFQDGLRTEDIMDELEKKYSLEATIESGLSKKKTKTKKIETDEGDMQITLEVMAPILKVIENQEIIISELRNQNKLLSEPKKKGLISRIFS